MEKELLYTDTNRRQWACLRLKVLVSLKVKPTIDEVLLRPKCPAPNEVVWREQEFLNGPKIKRLYGEVVRVKRKSKHLLSFMILKIFHLFCLIT